MFICSPNTPKYIIIDQGKLRQVLINLIGNGIKFTEKGFVILRVSTEACYDKKAKAKKRNIIKFEIEDTGTGIDASYIESVFEPFYQIQNFQRNTEGAGMGLAICRDFINIMGGEISVKSKLGKGSIFSVYFPLDLADNKNIEPNHPNKKIIGLAPGHSDYRILVVDDNRDSRFLLSKLLRSVGFEIQEAANGQEAIMKHKTWRPHLIWMDIRMPVIDGLEATKHIKSQKGGKDTIIVALTAHAFKKERDSILSSGCDDFVCKPFNENEIFDTITKHIGAQFIYDNEKFYIESVFLENASQNALKKGDLACLPKDLLTNLRQAALNCDMDLIMTAIENISKLNAPIGSRLAELAKYFQYDKLLLLSSI